MEEKEVSLVDLLKYMKQMNEDISKANKDTNKKLDERMDNVDTTIKKNEVFNTRK